MLKQQQHAAKLSDSVIVKRENKGVQTSMDLPTATEPDNEKQQLIIEARSAMDTETDSNIATT